MVLSAVFRNFGGMKRNRILSAIFLLWAGVIASLASTPFNIKGSDSAKAAILITDIEADTVVYAYEPNDFLIPASVMKSLTSASVTLTRDLNTQFKTPVIADGKITDGVLDGNLVVEVCGDPTLGSKYFKEDPDFIQTAVDAIKAYGIKEIRGTVMVTAVDFVEEPVPARWSTGDLLEDYGTGHHAANYRDNILRLIFPSQTTDPVVPTVKIQSISPKGSLRVSRERGSKTFKVSGASKSFSGIYANPDPEASLVYDLTEALIAADIKVSGKNVKSSGDKTVLYTHLSPVFRRILRSLMVRSDNMMAEGMQRQVAPGGTRQDAIDLELQLWGEAGLETRGVVIEDGSGLSRGDRLSPAFMTEVYKYMLTTPTAEEYVGLFPVAGADGTMKKFLKGTRLEGQLAMKTGSMTGIQCYGGYKIDASGRPTHTVVIFVNDFTCERAKLKNEIEALLLKIFD